MGEPNWWLLVALAAACGNAEAILSTSLEVIVEPPAASLLRGQSAIATITLTNTGDEPLDSAGAGFTYLAFGPGSTLFPFGTPSTPPCILQIQDLSPVPGQPGVFGVSGSLYPLPILPGESRQCRIGIDVSSEAGGPFVVMFSSGASREGQTVFSTREVFFPLGEQPTSISATSPSGLAILGLVALMLAGWRLRCGRLSMTLCSRVIDTSLGQEQGR
jgi:hypothetical protein